MFRVFLFLLVLFCFLLPNNLGAQIIATPSDTTACPDTEVFLHAEFDACLLTGCYEYEDIAFDWLTDPGTAITLSDNDHAGPFPLGFDFCFFGETYDEFWVCDNGWISFSPPTNAWSNNVFPNGPIPDAASTAPKNAVFAAWRDLYPSGGTSVVSYFMTGIPGYRKMYIKFAEMEHPYCDEGIISYFEIALHETENYIDNIFYQVELCAAGDEPSISGIQNADGSIAYTSPGRNFTEWDALSESTRWKPNNIRWIMDGDTVAYGPDMSFFPAVSTDVIAMVIGCDGEIYADTVHVYVPEYFDPEFEVTDNICYGESNGAINTTFPDGSTGYEIEWSNGETTEDLSGLESGYYILTVSDNNGCINEFSIYVDEPSQLVISPAGITDETCPGAQDGTITITAFGGVLPYTYSFEGSDFSDINFFDGLAAGDYAAVVQDANGCTYETIITVQEGETFDADVTAVSPIFEGQSTIIFVDAADEISTITWDPDGIVDPCPDEPCAEYTATLTETTTFIVAVSGETGCTDFDTVTIEVLPVKEVFFPNAFSPNDDGINDYFQSVTNFFIVDYHLRIYNRYGELVYENSDPNYTSGWDGKYNGTPQPVSTYTYRVSAKFENGNKFDGSGNFLLIR